MKYLATALLLSSTISYGVAEGNELDLQIKECSGKFDFIQLTKDDDIRIPPSPKGSTHLIKLNNGTESVEGVEKERESQIIEDIGTVIRSQKRARNRCIEYTQNYKRSTLELTTLEYNKKVNYKLIAGVEENWYLSADMPINNIKQLSYDDSNGEIVEQEKPASFYIGLNYKLGDIYTNYEPVDINNFTLKFLAKASSIPSESMGVGLGYDFKYIELFVADVWTKDDENIANNDIGYTDSLIFGVSFNINKISSWMQ